jgi:hypothetical protein
VLVSIAFTTVKQHLLSLFLEKVLICSLTILFNHIFSTDFSILKHFCFFDWQMLVIHQSSSGFRLCSV